MHRIASVVFLLLLLFPGEARPQAPRQQPPILTNETGLPGITGTPQGAAILRIEEARAPTPQDVALLIESARSTQGHIQDAALRALGRLERRDVVTDLLPYLRASRLSARLEAAAAIGQAMRGKVLPLDPQDRQLDGVHQALLSAASSEKDGSALGAMARTLGRLPYTSADHVARTDAFLRAVLELSSQLTRRAAVDGRAEACMGLELLARLHAKLFTVPESTLDALRGIATASDATVKLSDISVRVAAMQALVAAGGVDNETLRRLITDAFSSDLRRLSALSLAGAGSPVVAGDRLDHLRTAMADREYAVRYEALRGYVRHHAKSEGCQPVIDMLPDPHEHVVLLALDALGTCPADEDVDDRLAAEARTPPNVGSWRREAHALVSLARRAPARAEVPMLVHSRHPQWQVRMYAARAAGIADSVETLERLALDPHDNVRDAALGPLRRLRGDSAEPQFVAALGRRDYQLIRTAAREMAGLRVTPGLTAALIAAVERVTAEKKDTSRDARLALLERLREFGGPPQVEAVSRLLTDYDAVVAAAAAATLSAWTGLSYAVDPQPLPPQPLPTAAELAIVTNQAAYLEMESGRRIVIKLDPVQAPMMSTRFLRLVNRNYYDGLTFHRVVPNFVLQGGSPGANEYVGDGPYVKDEISRRSHSRGAVGLSTRGRDTGDAQLFINLVDNPRLDFEYTVFGHVANHDEIDRIMEGDRIVNISFGSAPAIRPPSRMH